MTNEFLRDLDQWDEESQGILLSLAEKDQLISVEEIGKSILRKGASLFEKIKINENIRRGETIRRMTNVHPFTTQYFSNLNTDQIDQRYFVDASKTTYNNVSIITDVDTENQALEVIRKEFYIDNNLNGKRDVGEYAFHLIIFQSKDGNKVNEAYKASSQPNSNEIVFYLEQGTDIFSSQKIYARVGEGIWERVLSKENVYKDTLWKVLNEQLKFSDKELILELLEKGKIEGNVIISSFLKSINLALCVLSAPVFAVGWLIEKIGEGLDLLRLPTTIWDVNGEGYFFEKDNLLDKLTISTEKINQLKQRILEDKAYQGFLPDIMELILHGMLNKLKQTLDNYNRWVTAKVTAFSESIQQNPEVLNDVLYDIALICGIWDGIVDTLSSTIIFIGQVAQSVFKVTANIDELLETVDNVFDFLTSGKVWESISTFFDRMNEELSKIDLLGIDLVKISYILGFGIIFIAGAFIPLTAVAKVGKIGNLGTKFGEMLTEVGKIVRTFPETMKSKTAIQQIDRLLDVFSSSEKTIIHAEKIANEIKKWLLKNKELILNKEYRIGRTLSKESKTEEFFRKIEKKFNLVEQEILTNNDIKKLRRLLKETFEVSLEFVDQNPKLRLKLNDWKKRGVAGSFNMIEGKMYLRKSVTAYTVQHEMFHMKLWYKMTKEFSELQPLFQKTLGVKNRLFHEEYVLAEFMKNPTKWSESDLLNDLAEVNRLRDQKGLSNVGLEYFKKWNLEQELLKFK